MDWFLYDNDLRHERVNKDNLGWEINKMGRWEILRNGGGFY